MTLTEILRISASPTATQVQLERAAHAAEALQKKASKDVSRAKRAYREALLTDGADPRKIAEIRSAAVARLEQRNALVDRLDARILAMAVATLRSAGDEDNLTFELGGVSRG